MREKDKKFKLSFDTKELVLFIGGISVICLLFYIYGINVGMNRTLEEMSRDTALQAAAVHGKAKPSPPVQESVEAEPEPDGEVSRGESAPGDEGESDKVGLTFYQTLPDNKGKEGGRPDAGKRQAEPAAEEQRAETIEEKKPTIKAAIKEIEKSPPVPSKREETGGGGYYVQVGSFKDWGKAMALKKRLTETGHLVRVSQTSQGAQGTLFRVRVGRFDGKKEADEAARKIGLKEHLNAFTIREKVR